MLTGEIPTELGNLSNLQSWGTLYELDNNRLRANNQLTGMRIPTDYWGTSRDSWKSKQFDNNQLTGRYRTELGNLSTTAWRNLVRDNRLTGRALQRGVGELDELSTNRGDG